MPDIDIDTPSSFKPQKVFPQAIPASMVKNGELVKHPVGMHFQDIKSDKVTNFAAIPYETAQELGFFKIDFLHLTVLDHFTNKQEIRELIKKEPNWGLLLHENNVVKLFQISKHFSLIKRVRPQSVLELADVVALIRPGKRQLLDEYLVNKPKVRAQLYRQQNEDKSAFKRSHAIAYALTIVLQLHLIEQGRM